MIHRHGPISLILLAFLLLAGAYSVVNPLFEAPDEIWHYEYVRWLAEGEGLPRPEDVGVAPWNQEGSQPPLYYMAAARLTRPMPTDNAAKVIRYNPHAAVGQADAFGNRNRMAHGPAEAWPWRGVALAAHLARFFSIFLGALAVLFTYMTARAIFPARPAIGLAAAILVAFNPQFLFISAAVSNDVLVSAVSAAALLLAISALGLRDDNGRQGKPGWGLLALMGLVAGLGALGKLSGLLVIPLFGVALSVAAWRRRSWREWLIYGLTVGGLALGIGGWWYARNWLLFRDPLALNVMFELLPGRAQPPSLAELRSLAAGVWRSYWAVFGWFNVVADEWVYALYTALTLVGLTGLAAGAPLRRLYCRRNGPKSADCRGNGVNDSWQIGLLIFWIAGVALLLARWTQISHPQGRLLFPAIGAMAILLAWGLGNWLPARGQGWVPVTLTAIMLPLALWMPWRVIAPAYAPPLPPAGAQPTPVDVDFGGLMALRSYKLGATELKPGETLPLALTWEALQAPDRDYSVFIHLTDENEILQAQQDSYPGLGARPTGDWIPGETIYDPHAVRVPETALAPARLRVDVGVYDYVTGQRLPVEGGDQWTLGYVTLLPSAQGDLLHSVSINFGDEIALMGFDFDRRVMRPGDSLTLTLWWEALARPAQDYAVFTHLVLPPDAVWAQQDGQPQNGSAPTSAWKPGQQVEDVYTLTLPADAPPGVYFVEIGIYDRETFDRLPVNFSDKGVVLGQVRVEENE